MKNLIILLFATALAFSCTPDPCKDVVCGTNGTCTEGICICEAGYEQDSLGACNTQIRAKFVGSYTMVENCTDVSDNMVYSANHSIVITNATDVQQMLMTGLAVDNAGTIITSTPSGTSFTVADDTQVSVDDNAGGSVLFNLKNVSGTLTGSTLNISYDLHSTTTGALLYTCTATGTKL